MSRGDDHNEILRRAVEAAREGERKLARSLIEGILEEDDTNARAWLLLYRISEDIDEKRMALSMVLEHEPENEKAREALLRLNERMGIKGEGNEMAPGVNRGTVRLIALVAGVVLVAAVAIVALLLTNSAQQESSASATQTAFVLGQTVTQSAVIAQNLTATSVALFATQTQIAIASPTLTPTETLIGPPTLPPTFTPTPTLSMAMSPTPLPPPVGLNGTIIGWGGVDVDSDGFLQIVTVPINGGGAYNEVSGDRRGQFVTATNLANIVYTRYVPDTFMTDLQTLDATTGITDILGSRWLNFPQTFYRATTPQFSADGNYVVFAAYVDDTQSYEVFIYDATIAGADPIRRVTNDLANYSYPVMHPNGTQIVAVRREGGSGTQPQDIVVIDLQSFQQTNVTSDGGTLYEIAPRVSPDGALLVYAASPSPDAPKDLFVQALGAPVPPLNITDSPDINDTYPVFSPDGLHIAFSSNRSGGGDQIYIYDVNSGQLNQLTSDPFASFYPGAWVR